MLLNMSLILKTVNNNNISVGFNLQYSANEGIKHINLIYLLIKWELDLIFGKQMSLLLKLKHGRNSVLCDYSQQKL